MRFSSGAPTTPTTTTSIDLIENAQGKRGSNSGVVQAPIQIVEVEHAQQQQQMQPQQQQQLNGSTPHQDELPSSTPPSSASATVDASDKVKQSIAAAIAAMDCDGSQTLPDDDGNV
jgi:hypothetical protein